MALLSTTLNSMLSCFNREKAYSYLQIYKRIYRLGKKREKSTTLSQLKGEGAYVCCLIQITVTGCYLASHCNLDGSNYHPQVHGHIMQRSYILIYNCVAHIAIYVAMHMHVACMHVKEFYMILCTCKHFI